MAKDIKDYLTDDWEQMAKDYGVYGQFSPYQLEIAKADPNYGYGLGSAKIMYAQAKTPEEKAMAHSMAEEHNASYGFSGGTDGSMVITRPTQQTQNAAREAYTNYGDFSWDREPDYSGMLARVTNPDPFFYDYKSDPSYQAYAKQYTREGRRASEDTMGQYAAMTGGRPSTAAVTASQQAGNYYGAQLADKIPELYQQAYQRYLNEYNMRLQGLNALQQDYAMKYGEYGDKANRLRDYYDIAASENAAATTAANNAEQTAYQRRIYDDETAYAREQAAKEWARTEKSDAMKEAEWRAQYGDYSGLRALGIDVDTWLAQQQAGRYYGGSGGSGKGGKGGSGGGGGSSGLFDLPETTSPDYLGAINSAIQNGYTRDATITSLAGKGVSTDDILNSRQMEIEDTNKGGYVPTASETLAKEVSGITTQKQAVEWLTSKGLSSRDWQIPSEAQFNRGKNDPQSDYYGYSTYAQFLRDYVQYIYSEFGGKQ